MPTSGVSWRATLSIPSCGSFYPFDHERSEFSPTDWRRLQFFENLVGSRASEWPPVPLLHLVVRRYSTTDDGLLLRRQIHDRKLTVLAAADAYSDESRTHDLGERPRVTSVGDVSGYSQRTVRRGVRTGRAVLKPSPVRWTELAAFVIERAKGPTRRTR